MKCDKCRNPQAALFLVAGVASMKLCPECAGRLSRDYLVESAGQEPLLAREKAAAAAKTCKTRQPKGSGGWAVRL